MKTGIDQIKKVATNAWKLSHDSYLVTKNKEYYHQFQDIGGQSLKGFQLFNGYFLSQDPKNDKTFSPKADASGTPYPKVVLATLAKGVPVASALHPPIAPCVIATAKSLGELMWENRICGVDSMLGYGNDRLWSDATKLALAISEFEAVFCASDMEFSETIVRMQTVTEQQLPHLGSPDNRTLICAADILTALSYTTHWRLLILDISHRQLRRDLLHRLSTLCDCLTDGGLGMPLFSVPGVMEGWVGGLGWIVRCAVGVRP